MKVVVFTLGCKVNSCESDSIIKALKKLGYEVSEKIEFADIYILNTCAVTLEAEKKSRQAVARLKKFNPNAKIYVCGCAVQKNPNSFLNKENVIAVSGARNKSDVVNLIQKEGENINNDCNIFDEMEFPEHIKSRAYVKIQDGCNNFCSYCIVPYLRGKSRSRSVLSIKEEVSKIEASEIVLTGINLSSYKDGDINLAGLLENLQDVEKRIRLGSLEANIITEKFLESCKLLKDFAPHFHLSLQSGSKNVLKNMNRRYTPEEFYKKCELIREYFPNSAITTDVIVGFPLETDEDFEESRAFIEKVNFSDIHCFSFSARLGTKAYEMEDIAPEIKRARLSSMLILKEELKDKFINSNLNKELSMIIEEEENGYLVGYLENYIRCYLKNNGESGKIKVKLIKKYAEGCLVERI